MAEQLRVIVIKDESVFIAQCLEVDIAAQGRTSEEAMTRLKAVLRAEIELAEAEGRSIEDIGPAPKTFHAMYKTDIVDRQQLVA